MVWSPASLQTTSKMYDPFLVIGGSYAESVTVAWDDGSPAAHSVVFRDVPFSTSKAWVTYM